MAGSDDAFTFTHDKIREVLYEELNPIRRRRLHRIAAEGLESHSSMRRREACLPLHSGWRLRDGTAFTQSGPPQRPSGFLLSTKRSPLTVGRLIVRRPLGLVDEQLEQQESIGKVCMLHGETIAAGEHFEHALALTNDPNVRARLQLEAASSLAATGDQRGLEYIREALKVLDPDLNPLETAKALSIEARSHHLAGRHLKAIELLNRAADLVAPAAAADSITSFAAPMITQIYAYLAGANQHLDSTSRSDRWALQALEFGNTHNVLFAQATGFEFLGENAIHKGEFEAGLEYAERELEIADRLHSRERRAWVTFYAGMCSFFNGDSARAEREFTEGMSLAESIGELRAELLLRVTSPS